MKGMRNMNMMNRYPYANTMQMNNLYSPYETNLYPNSPVSPYAMNQQPYAVNPPMMNEYYSNQYLGPFYPLYDPAQQGAYIELKDYGPAPYAVNIHDAAVQNTAFRTALWTGNHLQVTLMSLNPGEDIGLEIHHEVDQFICIEQGEGLVMMGDSQKNLDFQRMVYDDFAFIIPSGTWHNLINTGSIPLKLYSIYAPPQHPRGTVHETKADAMAAE
ncbi:MAG: cupin domain-containing protein [Ruminiclostridium sp.]|nr:cupin domain-containing protein [Ruminiclostridium sp.]